MHYLPNTADMHELCVKWLDAAAPAEYLRADVPAAAKSTLGKEGGNARLY